MSDRDDEKPADPHRDLAGVLHDVANALTVLLGWVGEARSPSATPETIASALTIIEQRARIARDISRHAIGSPRIDEQRALADVVAEVVGAMHVEANRAGVTITSAGTCAAKVAGALDVTEILTNLVLNALAYAPKGTAIGIEAAEEGERCSIVVTDAGPGVPANLPIFDGASVRPGGTGIGLRHSRALARAWGGDLELVGSEKGGARFRLSWPRIDVVPRPVPVSGQKARELAGKQILLVEDDDAVTQLLETSLEARGADVTIAKSVAELAKASGPFDVALVDLSPIAADVAGAIAKLRAASPEIQVVLITGSADALPDAIDGVGLVRKPFEIREVLAAITKPRV